MNEPLDPRDEIDDTSRDEEISALKEDVKALRGMLRMSLPHMKYHAFTLRDRGCSAEYELTTALIAEIEKELEN